MCKFSTHRYWKNQCSALKSIHYSPRVDFTNQSTKEWRCILPTSPWHCPPTQFASAENKYEGVDTFAVIRNPYTRILSEYYWAQRFQHQPLEEKNNRDKMNAWIMDALDRVKETGTCAMGHCIPSHKYFFSEGKQIVTHILRMENLTDDFRSLMHKYNLQLELEHTNSQHRESTLGVHDLSPDSISKINDWARMDFEYFGYDMMDPEFKAEDQLSSDHSRVELMSEVRRMHIVALTFTLILLVVLYCRLFRSLKSTCGVALF